MRYVSRYQWKNAKKCSFEFVDSGRLTTKYSSNVGLDPNMQSVPLFHVTQDRQIMKG